MFDRCTSCEKLLNTNGNLVKHGAIVASTGVGITLAGWTLLGSIPGLFGFKVTGIAASSIASTWQSSMGSVSAGSMFSSLQSLGATGMASSLMSSFGTVPWDIGAFYLLSSTASKLSYCECEKPLIV